MRRSESRSISRRGLLRGAGVALALPWLESLDPRTAKAQLGDSPKRFITIFFPNGTAHEYWDPASVGEGAAWQLSPVLDTFGTLKSKMIVLSNVENYTPYRDYYDDKGASHGRRPGCFLTCSNVLATDPGPSADQVIARHPNYANLTPLQSLQVGLGTSNNSCDGPPCPWSRNITWADVNQPMDPEIDPGAVFDRLVGAGGGAVDMAADPAAPDPAAEQRRMLNQSVLDLVMENTTTVSMRLGVSDRAKMDQFLESVRTVEQRATQVGATLATPINGDRPTLQAEFGDTNVDGGYNKGDHATVMHQLITMALQSDVTRIVTHMMEHERSEFVYSHVTSKNFTSTGFTETNGTAGNYHGAQHGSAQDFATITQWNAMKVAELCSALDAIEDGPGMTLLDNSIIVFASCMDGGGHNGDRIPTAIIGGGGGVLKTDQHIAFPANPNDRPLRDLYFTIMNSYFGIGATDFGNNEKGTPISIMEEILA